MYIIPWAVQFWQLVCTRPQSTLLKGNNPRSSEAQAGPGMHQTTAVAKIFHSDIGSSTTHPNHPAFLLQEVKITGDWHVAYGHQSSAV